MKNKGRNQTGSSSSCCPLLMLVEGRVGVGGGTLCRGIREEPTEGGGRVDILVAFDAFDAFDVVT